MKSRTKKEKISLVVNPDEYFRNAVGQAFQNQKFSVDVNTEFYLVNLLTRFMVTENFYNTANNGEKREDVLALLYGEAMSEPIPIKKQEGLRRLGDVSLYTAGFFAESLNRKTVDLDYYIGMGRNAYNNLSSIHMDQALRIIFADLAQRFSKFVDVLAEISETSIGNDVKNLLRVYETWVKTGSERSEKQLKEAGIIPNKNLKPSWQ